MIKAAAVAVALMGAGAANAAIIHTDGATDFSGQYRGVGTFSVGFNTTSSANSISFDLFGARSVDGNNTYRDVFEVALNGVIVFAGSFSMSGGGTNVVTLNTLGWDWDTATNTGSNPLFLGGVTSVSGMANLINGANTFSVTFSQPGPANGQGQGRGDESWALNNLNVSAVPLPAALPLLGLALAGLGGLGLRRRKAARV